MAYSDLFSRQTYVWFSNADYLGLVSAVDLCYRLHLQSEFRLTYLYPGLLLLL